jgi:sec-independent protein translocase protein TatA
MNSILLFMGIGMEEMLVIGLVVLVFFGADKVPDFMKGLGKGVREFKNGLNKIKGDVEDDINEAPTRKAEPVKKEETPSLPVTNTEVRTEENQD